MLHKLQNMRNNTEEGFTLIELLVVIVIIGVLAAIALPIFMNQQKAAAEAAVKSDLRNAAITMQTYFASKGKYPTNFSQLTSVNITVSDKENYTTITNLLVCSSNSNFAIVAQTSALNVYSYSTVEGGLKTLNTVWPKSYTELCPLLGVKSTDPGYIAAWGYANQEWATWVK